MTMNRTMCVTVLAAALSVIQGCAAPGGAIDKEAQARVVAEPVTAPKPEEFPDLGSARWKQGAFPSTAAFGPIRIGMGKDQVRELLGWPHFSEGLWGVREWNYIFQFRTGKGADYMTCQYMVRFNNEDLSTGGWWKNPDCALFAHPPEVVAGARAPILLPPQKVTLSTDGLFRFDGAKPNDLLPEGQERVARLAVDIQANFKALHYVTVTGHTDRLGTDAYNQALSQARANTVRELLVQAGIDRAKVRASGMGKRQPVAIDCEGARATPELVKCLQPNRRVEIEVVGGS